MNIEQVKAQNWQTWLQANSGVVLDVRESFEWATTGVLPGSELISLGQIHTAIQTLDRKTPVLVVCQSGNRSQQAAMMLAQAGFEKVANLSGGIMAVAA